MPRLLDLLVLLVLLAPLTAADDPKAVKEPALPKWTVHGLSVMKGSPDAERAQGDRGPGPGFGALPLLPAEGTRVILMLQIPDRAVLAYDSKGCKIDSLTDDKGTDLLKGAMPAPEPAGRGGPAGTSPRVTGTQFGPEGKSGIFTFSAPGLPAAGAMKLRVKGSVAVVVGSKEKEVEKKDVSIKDGVDLEFGKLSLIESPFNGRNTTTAVSYKGTKPIKKLTLLDADGKEIAIRRSTMPPTGSRDLDPTRDFPARFAPTDRTAKIDKCTVRVTYFDTVETVTLPVDLETGLGF
jgi:hypothetical protein